jgi:uncharacterized protein YggE
MNIRGLTLGLGVMFALLSISALAQDKTKSDIRTITVNGSGEVKAKPDVAYVTLGVVTQGVKAQEASEANASLTQKVTQALKSLGIADKDIQTSQYSIYPRYDNRPGKAQTIIGYDVNNTVRACIHDLTMVGRTIDASLAAGANNVQGVSFDIEKKDKYENEALADAVKNAKSKADVLASAAGVRIVGVQQIQEGTSYRPVPIYAMRTMAMGAEASTPIAPGEMTITANVTVVYLIAPEK